MDRTRHHAHRFRTDPFLVGSSCGTDHVPQLGRLVREPRLDLDLTVRYSLSSRARWIEPALARAHVLCRRALDPGVLDGDYGEYRSVLLECAMDAGRHCRCIPSGRPVPVLLRM